MEKYNISRFDGFEKLCIQLRKDATTLDHSAAAPAEQLQLCAKAGLMRAFHAVKWGGLGWNQSKLLKMYLALSSSCLTTAFILSQHHAAIKRISKSPNDALKLKLLPQFAAGKLLASVALSHLTTSHRHLSQPTLKAMPHKIGFVLDGFSPWVTGASLADIAVAAATLADGRELIVALPMNLAGVTVSKPMQSLGWAASQTCGVNCKSVIVPHQ